MLSSIHLVFIISMVTSWYPVATQDLEPINPDNLDPDASHVCQKTTEVPYTVLESVTHLVTMKTNTWCFALPPRCTQYYHQVQSFYRKATRFRQKKEYFCCEGYKAKPNLSYCVPKCKEDCYNSAGHGNCILPGECVCNIGYRGTYCESFCPEGYWGNNCTKQCNCSSTGSCDPEKGTCICHIGYTGSDCSMPCFNSFGLNCVHRCVCENNSTCNNINGKCTCRPGYYGYYCQKACEAGSIQAECEDVCLCQNGGTCDANKLCVCKPGYKGVYCTDKCDSLHWGLNCSNICTCYSGKCDHASGKCSCYIGYTGDSCERQCPPGFYGYECSFECPCKNGGMCYYGNRGQVECNCAGTGYNGTLCTERVCKMTDYVKPGTSDTCIPCQCPWGTADSCHPKTAVCDCKPGYRGAFCDETCTKPYWGKNCVSICGCNHGDCDIKTGECVTCHAGFQGTNCTTPCPNGKWGPNCPFDCLCENGADCHGTTGYCNCTAGFYGLTCEDFCPENKYGPSCVNNCICNRQTSICNPYTGQCQCKPGYSGTLCDTPCVNWKYGFQCLHDCKCNKPGTKTCDLHTGECDCKPGWKGATCNSQCADNFWGEDCAQPCPCHPYGSCDQSTGKCLCYPGYQGTTCEKTCETGFYGYNCTEPCPVCYEGTICNFVTGECTKQVCPPGLTGLECQQVCRYGTWGNNCGKRCDPSCLQNGYCNPTNGQCTCRPGYTGRQCNSMCSEGKYGKECNATCSCVVANSLDCHHMDGCRCKSGYTGPRCEKECTSGSWGPECRLRCSDICEDKYSTGCNPHRGLPCLCINGYDGFTCSYAVGTSVTGQRTGSGETKSGGMDASTIGLAVLVAILVVAIIVVVIFFLRRQKRREKMRNEMPIAYSSQNSNVPVTSANGTAVGVVNPTYEAQNTSNELRFPRLEQRATLPSPPRRTCEDEIDEIVDAKLRVDLSRAPSSRRTSGHYDDVDDNRYTTLGSVMGGDRSSGEIGIPDWKYSKDSKHKRASNDYMFYMGHATKQGQGHADQGEAPPPRRLHRSSGSYINSSHDTSRNVNATTISSPLYDVNNFNPEIITNRSHQDALNTGQVLDNIPDQASGNTDLDADQSKANTTHRKEMMAQMLHSNALSNPYDLPKPSNNHGQTLQPNGTLGGYITPINDVNCVNPYQNDPALTFDIPSMDQNQNDPALTFDIPSMDQNQNEVQVPSCKNHRNTSTDSSEGNWVDFGENTNTELFNTDTVA